MSRIDFMLNRMEEELEDACTYVDWAIKCKEEDKSLSELLIKLSDQELDHYNILKNYFEKTIDKMKIEHPDKAHKAAIIYEWECEKYAEKEYRIKMKHTSFATK